MFKRVEEWVLENRDAEPEEKRNARLPFVNDISAGERKFISSLAAELHLDVAWDEYDEQDQNLIVLRLPAPPSGEGEEEDDDDDAAWEDDDESRAAIDRVLKKYNQANVLDDEGFDDRYEMALRQKMDQWKDQYYKVCERVLVTVHYLTTIAGKARVHYPRRRTAACLPLLRRSAMGHVLLLLRSGVLGLVLRLPLRTANLRCVPWTSRIV